VDTIVTAGVIVVPRRAPVRGVLLPGLVALWRFVRNLALAGSCLAVGMCGLFVGTSIIVAAHDYQPRPLTLSKLFERTAVYTHDGLPIGTLGIEDRASTSFHQVPQHLIDAVVAAEDRTFWENSGIDPGGLLRAFVTNASAGRIEEGGSTITQQLVKNRLLGNNRDLERKVKELALARRLNDHFPKRRILTEYLNTVYFGQGSYGVQAAAERFFRKPLTDVTLGEAALLAGLISSPEQYNPFTQPDGAVQRRHEVLDLMVDEGYVPRSAARAAEAEPLPTTRPPPDLRPRSYFVEEAQQRLLADPRLGADEAARRKLLLTGGLKVYTTEDAVMQYVAAAAILRNLPDQPPFTATIVVIEPGTGKVRAMVGARPYVQSQYNLATHAPGRQPGSAFKMITLATALEAGISPQARVNGASPCVVSRPGLPLWKTRNSEGNGGVMTLRDATVSSVNCAYARLIAALGPDKVIDMAHRLGIQQDIPRYLPITLGTSDATPLEMATVAATLAADGVKHQPRFVEKVVGPDGQVLIDDTSTAGEGVISPEVARCTIDVLRGVVARGTGTRARLFGRDVAGKTGTTDEKSDAWFVGMTPGLVGTVWMGAPEARVPMTNVGGITVFGGTYPAEIWHDFMDGALRGHPAAVFPGAAPACNQPLPQERAP
jgi:penicillin-binding protein 1A